MGTDSPVKLDRLIRGTTFTTDRKKYIFAQLKREDFHKLLKAVELCIGEYVEILYDKDELTLIMPEDAWKIYAANAIHPAALDVPIARITCEVKEPTVPGFLLTILKVLSPADINVFVQGAFTTDHIFVYYSELDRALEILQSLKNEHH